VVFDPIRKRRHAAFSGMGLLCRPGLALGSRTRGGPERIRLADALDGIWFGIGNDWIGPAARFTSGYGHVEMELPDQGGMKVTRTDFVPDGRRAVLVGPKFHALKPSLP
jgi:hypothetical protein